MCLFLCPTKKQKEIPFIVLNFSLFLSKLSSLKIQLKLISPLDKNIFFQQNCLYILQENYIQYTELKNPGDTS